MKDNYRLSGLIIRHLQGDAVLWGAAFILALISLLEVYSTTGFLAYKNKAYNTEHYLLERLLFLGFGFIAMYIVHRIPPRYFNISSNLILVVSIILLILTLFFGSRVNDANRWLKLPGLPFSFQPSDLAKLGMILFLSRHLALCQSDISNWKRSLVFPSVWLCVICLLILPANFSTAAMIFLISFLLMFIARIPLKFLLTFLLITILIGLFSIFILSKVPGSRVSTWKSRIENFGKYDNNNNYQTELAQMAIATGRLTGSGPGNNPYRYLLPQGSSDFIFSMIAGEWGILGSGFVILIYLVIMYRSVRIALNSSSAFALFLSIGIGLMITVQAFINMLVGSTLIPVTGQPLPLVSMGGTGTIFTCAALGILLSISRYNKKISENYQNIENK